MMRRAAILCLVLAACTPETKPAEAPVAQTEPATAQPAEAAAASAVNVDVGAATQPADGSKVMSPLEVAGIAPNDWYFEAVFPLTLVGADGAVLAEAPAQAQTDWTVVGPVTFRGRLAFNVDKDTPATLVLEEDMPGQDDKGDDKPARTVRIPVVLAPAAS
jgi:hypothetical protein